MPHRLTITQRFFNGLLATIHHTMLYLLMLIAMTYNVGLFVAVMLGYGVGYASFEGLEFSSNKQAAYSTSKYEKLPTSVSAHTTTASNKTAGSATVPINADDDDDDELEEMGSSCCQ